MLIYPERSRPERPDYHLHARLEYATPLVAAVEPTQSLLSILSAAELHAGDGPLPNDIAEGLAAVASG